jgi:hypothetical protein
VIRLTASALDRVFACPPSAILPQARQAAGAAADTGTATHKFIEAVRARAASKMVMDPQLKYEDALEEARTELLAAIPEDADHYALCEGFDFGLLPLGAQLEVALAWSYSDKDGAGRLLGEGLERNYSGARAGELVGTADLVGRIGDDVLVADWKTGHKLVDAENAWQLRFLAVAAAAAVDASGAQVALVYLRDDGKTYVDRAVFTGEDLAVFRTQLRALARHLDQLDEVTAARSVSLGPWCRYCPALASCPGQTQLVRRLAERVAGDVSADTITAETMVLSKEGVGRAYQRLELAEQLLRHMRAAIDVRVRQEGEIELADGRVLQEQPTTRRYLIGEIANAVLLRDEPELAMRAVKFEPVTSRAAIESGLVQLGRKKKDAGPIVEKIAAAGGIRTTTSTPVRAVVVKGAKVAPVATAAERELASSGL